jgi:hypothetical protein
VTWVPLVGALLVSMPTSAGDEHGRPCHQHPSLIGSCVTVHGRMNYWNGTPSVRIWKVGTTRMLGVSEARFKIDGYENLPGSLQSRLSWHTDLFADFVVCPFTPEKPGVMQLVCVDSATRLVVRARPAPHQP